MLVLKRLIAFLATTCVAVLAGGAVALAATGEPEPWQIGLQAPATPVAQDITWFNDFLFWIIAAIAAFVLVLLLIVIFRFNARANP
ncbi:MAG TPA: cytochrome c oxidase subunit II transmembrane domain-containing protein, partial [Pirellulales bacterium]|nr:cytochrome c oxidase subunit II transmembrane domain-containing protein [Pirellulales bacterium]